MEFLFSVGQVVFRKRRLGEMSDLFPVVDCPVPHSSDSASGFFTCLLCLRPCGGRDSGISGLRRHCLRRGNVVHYGFSSATSEFFDSLSEEQGTVPESLPYSPYTPNVGIYLLLVVRISVAGLRNRCHS
jgi:hypothetical protein